MMAGTYHYENKKTSLEIIYSDYPSISVVYSTQHVNHCVITSKNNSDDWLYQLNVYASKKKCCDINVMVKLIRKFINQISDDKCMDELEREIRENKNNKNEILINEFLNIASGEHKYKCTLDENNIYKWNISMKNFIGRLKNNIVDITINFDENFPNSPPIIVKITPTMKNSLEQKIKKLQFITTDWDKSINVTYIFDKIYEILEKYGRPTENKYYDEVLRKIIDNLSESLTVSELNVNIGSNVKSTKTNDNIFFQKSTTKKSGIGYDNVEWMMTDYAKSNTEKHYIIICTMKELDEYLNVNQDEEITKNKYNYLINSEFPECIHSLLNEMTAIELTENQDMYNSIYALLNNIPIEYLAQILSLSFGKDIIEHISTNIKIIFKCADNNVIISEDAQEIIMTIDEKLTSCQKYMIDNAEKIKNEVIQKEQSDVHKITYKEVMEKHRFEEDDITKNNYHYNDMLGKQVFNKKAIIRLTGEYSSLNKDLPVENDASIFVKIDPMNMSVMRALIVGPKDTPYENGCLIFDIFIPGTYPTDHPDIHFMNHGGCRFNPNLYSNGKVCLSLIGTWGHQVSGSSENWNAATSTIFQLLLSVQSQIFVEEPWFNEPCRYSYLHDPKYKKDSEQYNNQIQYYNLQFAIIDLIKTKANQYGDFAEIILNHFRLKKEEIYTTYSKSSSVNVRAYMEANKQCLDAL